MGQRYATCVITQSCLSSNTCIRSTCVNLSPTEHPIWQMSRHVTLVLVWSMVVYCAQCWCLIGNHCSSDNVWTGLLQDVHRSPFDVFWCVDQYSWTTITGAGVITWFLHAIPARVIVHVSTQQLWRGCSLCLLCCWIDHSNVWLFIVTVSILNCFV